MEKIILLVEKLTNKINELNSTFLVRYDPENKAKLNFINTLFASLHALKCSGIESCSSILEEEKITTVTKTALINKRNDEKTYKYIRELNDNLIEIFYDKNNNLIHKNNFKINVKHNCYIDLNGNDNETNDLFINKTNLRFVGCDCTKVDLLKSAVNSDNIKLSSSGNYGTLLLSSLFDIINSIPINYHSVHSNEKNFNKKKVNETTGLLDQLNKLNNNDVIVMDKWYYSKYLHKKFIDKNIGYIFRVKDNSLLFRNMGFGKSKIIKLNDVDVQLFKYKIKGKCYHILTSITEKISIAEIKALYWRRWKIETDNKKFKYDILSSNIRSKKNNSIAVDIECIKFMSIISSIIEHIGKGKLKENKKFHTRNCIGLLFRRLLKIILYEHENYEEICRLVGIIYKKIVDVISGREAKRIRVSPSTKWNANGNRYGGNK